MKNKLMEKEQQKQHLIDMMRDDENLGLYENWVEDAEKESNLSDLNDKANIFWSGFRVGVKSKERMYSDKEVMNALHSVELKYNKDFTKIYEGMKEWFEQYKNK
jgi:hypothetical protein